MAPHHLMEINRYGDAARNDFFGRLDFGKHKRCRVWILIHIEFSHRTIIVKNNQVWILNEMMFNLEITNNDHLTLRGLKNRGHFPRGLTSRRSLSVII